MLAIFFPYEKNKDEELYKTTITINVYTYAHGDDNNNEQEQPFLYDIRFTKKNEK